MLNQVFEAYDEAIKKEIFDSSFVLEQPIEIQL